MIKKGKRDLLVVLRDEQSIAPPYTLKQIEALVIKVEMVAEQARVSEIVDLNRYRIINSSSKVAFLLEQGITRKPFYFVVNLN